jgi:hypothetical protein
MTRKPRRRAALDSGQIFFRFAKRKFSGMTKEEKATSPGFAKATPGRPAAA